MSATRFHSSWIIAAGVLTVGLASGLAVVRAQDPQLPDKPGKEKVEALCGSTCHGIGTVLKERRTPASWKITVREMMDRGAPGSDEDFEAVIAFLSAHLARINVNKADASALQTFLDISAAEAEAIVAYRTAHGPFKKIDDVKQVPHVDGATLERCKDRIAFEG